MGQLKQKEYKIYKKSKDLSYLEKKIYYYLQREKYSLIKRDKTVPYLIVAQSISSHLNRDFFIEAKTKKNPNKNTIDKCFLKE